MNLDSSDIHWQSTLDILHNKNNTGSFYTSPKDSSLRSHRVKKLCGVLPTQDIQHTHRPDIYTNALCPCCEDQEESNEHLWNCDAHIAAERRVWTQTIEAIPEWVQLEEARLWRAWAKERDRHMHNQQPFTTAAPKLSTPSGRAVWTSLQHISGAVDRAPWDLRRIALNVAEKALQQWKVADLYRGISPHSLTQVWSKLLKLNITTAQNLVHRFCRTFEERIRETVWLDRCNRQIPMEKEQGITQKMKKTLPPRERGVEANPWRSWVGAPPTEDECECQLLDNHLNNSCPGFTGEAIEAEIFLLDTYLGRRRPAVMERMGSCKFLLS